MLLGCARQVRRLLALAAVYDGRSRTEAASIGGMDRQTLRDWALRFNADGPDGFLNRKGAGRPRLLSPDQMQALAKLVETGTDRAVHGVVRWRRIDLQRALEERFDVKVSHRRSHDCSTSWRSRTSLAALSIPSRTRP